MYPVLSRYVIGIKNGTNINSPPWTDIDFLFFPNKCYFT